MGRTDAHTLVGERISVPTLPDVVIRLQGLAEDPHAGTREIGRVASEDPGLSARILRIANGAFYGLEEPVVSVPQAATVIGTQNLKNLALQASVIRHYEHLSNQYDFDLAYVWKHAVETAQLAQELAQHAHAAGGLKPEDAYTCGLLHDLGKIVLLDGLGEEYLRVFRRAEDSHQSVHTLESEHLGTTHLDVGAVVAQRWNLPAVVARAIALHHGPTAQVESDAAVAVVAIADQLSYRLESPTLERVLPRLAQLAERQLGVRPRALVAMVRAQRETSLLGI